MIPWTLCLRARRRDFGAGGALAVLCLVVSLLGSRTVSAVQAPGEPPPARPNILFLFSDDGARHDRRARQSAYPNSQPRSPRPRRHRLQPRLLHGLAPTRGLCSLGAHALDRPHALSHPGRPPRAADLARSVRTPGLRHLRDRQVAQRAGIGREDLRQGPSRLLRRHGRSL